MSRSSWIAPEAPELVWFRGPDTIRFLNDLISQEIDSMQPGKVGRSLLLLSQGKLDHILWVLRGEDRVGLVTDPGRGEALAATLGRYRIRVKVEIEPSPEPTWLVMGEYGVEEGTWVETGDGVRADLSWGEVRRTLVVGPKPDLETGTLGDYEALRIAAGEPRWGIDVDEKTIPQETGLAAVSIDFAKGCYLGQELVARIDSRGHVNRHLRILEFDGEAPQPGAAITHGEKQVGVLGSSTGSMGMALVRREVGVGEEVSVNGRTAVVADLPP